MRVLITGHGGLVGAAVAAQLLERGFDCAGLSRSRKAASSPHVRQYEADISAPTFVETVSDIVDRCDAIVHAAADLSKDPFADSVIETNCGGTLHTLQLAKKWNVRSFVFLSGVTVIGTPRILPITEEHPTAPTTPYHASKLFGEYLVTLAEDVPGVSLRLTAPVGPGMPRGRIVREFIERAKAGLPLELHGTGARRQNYVDVRDVARAVAACIERSATGVLNAGGAETVSNLELAQRCIAFFHSPSPIIYTGRLDPADTVSWDVSIEAARRAIGYSPAFTLEDSIASCV